MFLEQTSKLSVYWQVSFNSWLVIRLSVGYALDVDRKKNGLASPAGAAHIKK